MRRRLSTGALAQRSARHPWLTIGAWGAALVAAVFLIGTFLGDALTTEADVTSKPESRAAELLVEERMPSAADEPDEVLVVRSAEHSVDDPAFRARIETLLAEAAQYGARPTASYYADGDKSLVSADRDTMAVPLAFSDDSDENVEGVVDLVSGARGEGGFETAMTGSLTADLDFNTAAEEDLQRGEMFGIGIALIVLLLVFGAVVASLLPILLALVSIVVALGVTALIGAGFELSFFVVNMLVMMGLAVGIDYSLFVVSRYREERGKGVEKMEAITASGLTASRAVFFSGITVVLALVGMFLVPSTIFRSLAVGAIVVVLVAVAAALTLLPAVLRLVGDRIDALRIPFVRRPGEGGFWARVARAVMRRPVVSLVASVAILVAATVPFAGINTGFAGVSTLPASFESKRGYELLAEELGYGTAPAEIVIDGDIGTSAVQAGIDRLETSLASEEGFGRPELEVNDAGNLAVLTVLLDGDESSNQATESVATLRDDLVPDAFAGVPAEVLVGGGTAENVDFFAITDRYLPIVVAFVLGLSFLLLAVAFRSLVVPATSILMNLLSVGAAFGLLVLVFQEGIGAGLFGFEQVETIEAWIPLFLFTVLFGLSMDYHVFLLSRIRERYDQTGDNTGSIAFGVATTARIITGAALIMVAVFGGFAAGQLVMFQQMGFGLGVAVLLDATIVRSVLVPATMRLLGDRNWYLPRRLEWLPDLRIEAPRANPAREHGSS
jgi:putative drug exporter of the RND superfamily